MTSIRNNPEDNLSAPSLHTRQQLVDWCYDLLPDPFDCPRDFTATYRANIRRLEWAARPLWGVFALIAGGERPDDPRISPFIERIRMGLTPGHLLAFPNPTARERQVVFEQPVFGYGLLCLGDRLLDLLEPMQRERLASWLNAANDIELPWGSWYLARILVNCGLKQCGLLEARHEARLAADCAAVESMYDGGGWYEDGTPFKRDLYIASAFHFTALLLERYMDENPLPQTPERANAFDRDYAYWFDSQGRCIPFGRSLTYRFANASFWSALALAGCAERPIGELKGLMFNHLSWWHAELAGQKGPECLLPGYGYQGAPVMEDYAGPGTSFWALKAFAALALPANDPFWRAAATVPHLDGRRLESRPGMLIQQGERHAYALSAMQYAGSALANRRSKYGKLCYSTAFGWNVSSNARGITGFAVDSALAIAVAGTNAFTSRTQIQDYRVHEGYVYSVWSYGSIARVESWLVPVDELRHVRVHRIQSLYPLDTYEGGFPVFGWRSKYDIGELEEGSARIRRASSALPARAPGMESAIEDVLAARDQIRAALRSAGLSDVMDSLAGEWVHRRAEVVRQSPRSNIYDGEPNAVPALRTVEPIQTACLACLVYGDPGRSVPGARDEDIEGVADEG